MKITAVILAHYILILSCVQTFHLAIYSHNSACCASEQLHCSTDKQPLDVIEFDSDITLITRNIAPVSCCKTQEYTQQNQSGTTDDDCHCSNPFCCIKQAPMYLNWELVSSKNWILELSNEANSGNPNFTNRQFSEIWHPPI